MEDLSSLLAGLPYELLRGSIHRPVGSIAYHSGRITKDCLFVCIRGQRENGHRFAWRAAEENAAAILAEELCELPPDSHTALIKVPDTRTALAEVSHRYFGYPARRLITVAVTGTKGKTTTACMIRDILRAAGIRTGYIGTLGIDCGYGTQESDHTTPESYVVAEALRQMADTGCRVAVLEASSVGLKQQRLCGLCFDIGVFLNLGNDHIGTGEHADAEEYFQCKAKLFRQCMVGICNADDVHSEAIARICTCREMHFFGRSGEWSAVSVRRECRGGQLGMSFVVPQLCGKRFLVPIPGMFNVENALAAIAVCRQLALTPEQIKRGLCRVFVPGRMENVSVCDSYRIYIDYAHNAMALEQVLNTLREYRPGRLLCLFGCGGNRALERRFLMGETSGRLADLSIVTSDNPRYEDADAIISDILVGMKRTNGRYISIPDRREAIAYALSIAMPGDILLLAGKGHETYQEICGQKYPMDERRILDELTKTDEKQCSEKKRYMPIS